MSNPATLPIYPAVHTQLATEFRLSQARGFRNLRVANLGCTIAGAAAAQYVDSAGCYALLQRVALYDGGTLLDEVLDAHAWLAFQNLRRGAGGRDNGSDWSMLSPLTLSSRTYALSTDCATAWRIPARNYYATNDAATTSTGWLHLSAALNVFAKTPYWDTKAFPNLRIVLEWRTDPSVVFAGTTAAITSLTVLPPVLLADRLDDAEVEELGPVPAVQFTRNVQEKVFGLAPGGTQSVRLMSPGGRTVNRLLFYQTSAAAASVIETAFDCLKQDCARMCDYEEFGFSVNGVQALPYSVVDSDARRQQLTSLAWGDYHISPAGGFTAWSDDAPADVVNVFGGLCAVAQVLDGIPANPPAAAVAGKAIRGPAAANQAYGGILIGTRVADLQFQYGYEADQFRAGAIVMNFYLEMPCSIAGAGPTNPAGYTFTWL